LNINDLWNNREFILFIIQVSLFVVQILSLIFLALYVWKTWQMASSTRESAQTSEKMIKEMRDARDQESAPYVVPYININDHIIFFGIKNIGKSVAINIKINITPEIKSSVFGDKIKDTSFIKNGLSSLPPGHELATMLDVSHIYLNRSDFPMSYLVKISYEGGLNKERRDYEQVLDLSVYKDIIPNEGFKLNDLAKSLEDISKSDKKISEELEKLENTITKGFWIRNPDTSVLYSQLDYSSWKLAAASKLKELKTVMERITINNNQNNNCYFSNDIKNRIDLIIGQIMVIASNSPIDVDPIICGDLNSFVFDFFEYTRSLSFLFRRRSDGFNEDIKKFIDIIDIILKKLA